MAGGGVIVPVGRLQVATPETMALAIRGNTAATDAVDERIELVAAEIIADDPTIVAAAEAAVDEALATTLALSKCVHFESGVPVYDGPGGVLATHHIFQDHTGEQVIRPTPFPVPLATPAFTW